MKNKKNLICLLGGLVLWLSGFWLVRRSGISWETLRALPYLMIGIGCGLFGYGVGEMVNRHVLDSNPTLAKEQEIAQNDERNVALANRAKAKAYDLMTYMMAALLLTFALMGVAMEVVVVLVLAYLAIEFYALYWRQRLEKENALVPTNPGKVDSVYHFIKEEQL